MKTYYLPENLVLDLAQWRCGVYEQDGVKSLGFGHTELLNPKGYMCCLGQFCLQAGVPSKSLTGEIASPDTLTERIIGLNVNDAIDFTSQAIQINDNERTTIEEKISELAILCQLHGRTLQIINKEQVCPQT